MKITKSAKTYKRGWFQESQRHSLAAQGIPTGAKSYAAKKDSLGELFEWTKDAQPKKTKKRKMLSAPSPDVAPASETALAEDRRVQPESQEENGFETIDWDRIEREAKEAKGFYARKFLTPEELERVAAQSATKDVPDAFEAEQPPQAVPEVVEEKKPDVIPPLELKNPEMLSMPTEARPQVLPFGVGLEVGRSAAGKEQWIAPDEVPRRTEFVTLRSEITPQQAQEAFNEEVRKRRELLSSLMLTQVPVKRSRVLDLKKRSLGTKTGFSDAMLARANRTYFEDEESALAYARVAERRPVEVGQKRGRVFVRKTDPEFDKPKQFPTSLRPSYVVEEEVLP